MTKEYENIVVLKGPKDLSNWRFSLEVKAKKKGVWDIINGIQLLPEDDDVSTQANALRIKIAVAADLIVQTTSSSLIPHIREYPGDPYKMYKRLLDVNSHGFEDIADTWTRFHSLKFRSEETAIDFIGRFREIRGELVAAKERPSDILSISVLLSALPVPEDRDTPSEWRSFRNQIKRDIQGDDLVYVEREILREYSRQNPDDEFDMDPVKEALVTKRRTRTSTGTGTLPRVPTADASAQFSRPHIVCHLCGGIGHFRSQCPSELVSGSGNNIAAFVEFESDFDGGVAL